MSRAYFCNVYGLTNGDLVLATPAPTAAMGLHVDPGSVHLNGSRY